MNMTNKEMTTVNRVENDFIIMIEVTVDVGRFIVLYDEEKRRKKKKRYMLKKITKRSVL